MELRRCLEPASTTATSVRINPPQSCPPANEEKKCRASLGCERVERACGFLWALAAERRSRHLSTTAPNESNRRGYPGWRSVRDANCQLPQSDQMEEKPWYPEPSRLQERRRA